MERVTSESEVSLIFQSMTYGRMPDGEFLIRYEGEWYILQSKAGHLHIWHMNDHDEAMTVFRLFDSDLQRLIDAKNSIRHTY